MMSEVDASWWGSWVKSAKDKSVSAMNMVKRDLAEFSSVMQEDTVKVASKVKEKLSQENANAATEKVKKGVNNLLGGISKALIIEPDDNYQPARIIGGEAIVFDRSKARLHAIQIDPSTYTVEPSGDRYQEWLSTTNFEDLKGDISNLLVSNIEVRSLYTQLVPGTASNTDFWKRYYFKRHLLEEEDAHRLELMKRADDSNEQKDLGWDEDDDEWSEARAYSSSFEKKSESSPSKKKSNEASFTTVPLEAVTSSSSHENEEKRREVKTMNFEREEKILPTSDRDRGATTVVRETKADDIDSKSGGDDDDGLNLVVESERIKSESSSSESQATTTNFGEIQSIQSSHSSDPSLSGWSGLLDVKSGEDDEMTTKMMDVIEVPSSSGSKTPSDDSSNTKESLDDEWEKDFDVEVTAEDLQAAEMSAKKTRGEGMKQSSETEDKAEDWEDW